MGDRQGQDMGAGQVWVSAVNLAFTHPMSAFPGVTLMGGLGVGCVCDRRRGLCADFPSRKPDFFPELDVRTGLAFYCLF